MRGRGYIIYSIISTLLQEAVAVLLVLWLLPMLGTNIPLWGLGVIMAVIAVWGFIGYWLSKDIINREVATPSNAMVGCSGKATTPINPDGVVRVRGELWKAYSPSDTISAGEDVTVVDVVGLTLYVHRS